MQKLIFTDLDGTLLDYKTYSYRKALKSLSLIKKNKIPLIFCTSKTKAEIEYYRKKLNNKHPFISENGAAIFIPKKYFDFRFKFNKENKKYFIIEYGTDIKKLKKGLDKIKKEVKLRSFVDMTAKEISKETNLPLNKAKLAKKRDYIIPFQILDKGKEKLVKKIIIKNGFNFTKGARYFYIMGNNNKGKAVKTLTSLYKKQFKKKITTYAFGDSRNDFEMLEAADYGFLVKKFNNKYLSSKYKKADGIGPAGFNKEVLKIIT